MWPEFYSAGEAMQAETELYFWCVFTECDLNQITEDKVMQFAAFYTFGYKVFFPSYARYCEWCDSVVTDNPEWQLCRKRLCVVWETVSDMVLIYLVTTWKNSSAGKCSVSYGISDTSVDVLVLCVCQESSCKISFWIRGFLWQRRGVICTLVSEEIVGGAIVLLILPQEDHVSSFT